MGQLMYKCRVGKKKIKSVIDLGHEHSAVGESQSNGGAENAVKQVQGQIRVLRDGLEARYQTQVDPEHPILPWLVRYSVCPINRSRVGEDGRTSWERITDKKFRGEWVEFGECVWYLRPKSKGVSKLDCRWGTGLWLGFATESNEIFIGTTRGVCKTRCIRRKGSLEQRWDRSLLDEMQGVP